MTFTVLIPPRPLSYTLFQPITLAFFSLIGDISMTLTVLTSYFFGRFLY